MYRTTEYSNNMESTGVVCQTPKTTRVFPAHLPPTVDQDKIIVHDEHVVLAAVLHLTNVNTKKKKGEAERSAARSSRRMNQSYTHVVEKTQQFLSYPL